VVARRHTRSPSRPARWMNTRDVDGERQPGSHRALTSSPLPSVAGYITSRIAGRSRAHQASQSPAHCRPRADALTPGDEARAIGRPRRGLARPYEADYARGRDVSRNPAAGRFPGVS
jgi:hypothetical protein